MSTRVFAFLGCAFLFLAMAETHSEHSDNVTVVLPTDERSLTLDRPVANSESETVWRRHLKCDLSVELDAKFLCDPRFDFSRRIDSFDGNTLQLLIELHIPNSIVDCEGTYLILLLLSMNLRPRFINFEESWEKLRTTVVRVLEFKPVDRKTWDYNFSDIYFMCVAIPESLGPRLFFALRECVEEHAALVLRELLRTSSHDLLEKYNVHWRNYHRAAMALQNLFGYLNKQNFKEQACVTDIDQVLSNCLPSEIEFKSCDVGKMILNTWRDHLLRPLASRLTPFILSQIADDRRELGQVDASPARDVLLSFYEVNWTLGAAGTNYGLFANYQELVVSFYQEIFEKSFIEETTKYYKYLANEVFTDLNCSAYMEQVLKKMEEESRRGQRFLHSSSLAKIDKLTSEHLVRAQLDRFLSVCAETVRKGNEKDLRNMHRLLRPWEEGINALIAEFEKHIREEGMQIVANTTNDATQMTFQIEGLHARYLGMINSLFHDDSDFLSALDRALQSVINHKEDPRQPPRISERLNRYLDGLLRKSSKNMSESELDTSLNKAITIFRYVDDKDLFQKYYAKMLSNRLISNLSHSMDAEELMIAKMKDACGFEFTSKLTRMFTDVGLSYMLNDRFGDYLTAANAKMSTPVSVMVLQAGAWPLNAIQHPGSAAEASTSRDGGLVIPDELQTSLSHFEKFYADNHNGRKLTWLHANSHVQVKIGYLDKPYVVSMNVYQLCAILLFQTVDVVTMQAVVDRLQLPFTTAHKFMKGFIDAGMLLADSLPLTDASIFQLNLNMTSKRLNFKITIPNIAKPAEKEIDTTCNTLQQDRKYYMECAVVRIMKSRKVMKHSALVEEVIKHTSPRFVPEVSFIKKTIEALIEKLYLQRTDQHDEYQYLA